MPSDYTRTMTVALHELVPDHALLPQCHAWKVNGKRCPNKAKFEIGERPVCGQHITPRVVFVPEKWLIE